VKVTDSETLMFEHQIRSFYIQCAKHVLDLAPLPEFQDAIAMLEIYDGEPTEENREDLKRVYRKLTTKRTRRDYGYTAVGEFHAGLTHTLACVLFNPSSVSSSSVQCFAEACWCAGRALRCSTAFRDVAERAQHQEYEWQQRLWDKIFPAAAGTAATVAAAAAAGNGSV
jgi:hypothetical protein